jgi:hypothetical protein
MEAHGPAQFPPIDIDKVLKILSKYNGKFKCGADIKRTTDGLFMIDFKNICYIPNELRNGTISIESHYLPILMNCIIPIQIEIIKHLYASIEKKFNPINNVVVVKGYSASHGEIKTTKIPGTPDVHVHGVPVGSMTVNHDDISGLSDTMPNIPEREGENTRRDDQTNMIETIRELRSEESKIEELSGKESKIEAQPKYMYQTECITTPYPLLLLNSAPCGYKFTGNYEIMKEIQNWYDNNRDYDQSHLKLLFYVKLLKIGVLIATIKAIMKQVEENIVQYDIPNNVWSIKEDTDRERAILFNERFLQSITIEDITKAYTFINVQIHLGLGLGNIYTRSMPNKYKRSIEGIYTYLDKLLRTATKILPLLRSRDALMRKFHGPYGKDGPSYNQKYLAYSPTSLIPGDPDICIYLYFYEYVEIDEFGVGYGEPIINKIVPIIKITFMKQNISPGVVDSHPVKLSLLCDIGWYMCRSFNKILYNVYKKVIEYRKLITDRVNAPSLSFFVGSCSGFSRSVSDPTLVYDQSAMADADADVEEDSTEPCDQKQCTSMTRTYTGAVLSRQPVLQRSREEPSILGKKRDQDQDQEQEPDQDQNPNKIRKAGGGTRKNRKRKTRKPNRNNKSKRHRKSMKSNHRRSLRRRSRKHSFNSPS